MKFSCNSQLFKTQDIHIYLISLEDNLTFLSIIHHFKENIQFEQIQEIEEKKKYLIMKIKDYFENENKNNETNESDNIIEDNNDNSDKNSLNVDLLKNFFESTKSEKE
jgi:hypothetical protein